MTGGGGNGDIMDKKKLIPALLMAMGILPLVILAVLKITGINNPGGGEGLRLLLIGWSLLSPIPIWCAVGLAYFFRWNPDSKFLIYMFAGFSTLVWILLIFGII